MAITASSVGTGDTLETFRQEFNNAVVDLGNLDGAAVEMISISGNNSTNETVYPVFVDVATGTQGAETDTGLTYNPSSGILTSTQFTGAVSGNATTATALASGRTIGMTGDVVWTSASFDGSGNVTGSAVIQATSVENSMLAGSIANNKLANSSITINGSAISLGGNIDLSETICDTVGAMFSSNSESGITVTYQDSDNTIDLTVGTLNQNTTGFVNDPHTHDQVTLSNI